MEAEYFISNWTALLNAYNETMSTEPRHQPIYSVLKQPFNHTSGSNTCLEFFYSLSLHFFIATNMYQSLWLKKKTYAIVFSTCLPLEVVVLKHIKKSLTVFYQKLESNIYIKQ